MPAYLPLNITEALQKGLRSNRFDPVNSLSLEVLRNAKPYSDGLRPFVPPTDPFVADFPIIDRQFPFPQIFKGIKENFLLEKDAIYTFDENFDSVALSTFDYMDGTTPVNIGEGGIWHFVDMGETWMFFNGNTIVFKDNITFGGANVIRVANDVAIGTGCKFRGRIITAGFTESAVWKQEWKNIFTGKDVSVLNATTVATDEFDTVNFDFRENFVTWSTIGQSDMAFRWLLYPSEARAGTYTSSPGYTSAKSLFHDAVRRNEFGWRPMSWKGKPLVIKPIGEHGQGLGAVVIYGEGGISALIPRSSPVPTFQLIHLSDVGVKSRGAVAGDDFEHIFLDVENVLWKIDRELQLTQLGYEEHFEGQIEDYILTYKQSHREKEYHICNSFKGFTLTPSGLSEQNILIGSKVVLKGEEIGTFNDNGQSNFMLVTGAFNMRLSGLKTVHQVFIASEDWEGIKVAVDYQYKPNEAFRRTEFIPLNSDGVATINIQARVFKIVLKMINSSTVINTCEIRWNSTDKTNVRGPNVSSSTE